MVHTVTVAAAISLAIASVALAQTGEQSDRSLITTVSGDGDAPANRSISVPQLSDMSIRQMAPAPEGAALASTARSARGELVAAPTQIGNGERSADAAPALSTRAQGRGVTMGALNGHDRCDVALGAPRPAECANAIETRGDQYGKPGPAPVTPEARLLLLTQPDQTPLTADNAVLRTGNADTTVDALAGAAAGVVANAVSSTRSSAPGAPSAAPGTVIIGPH